jgi:hypothetical protein
LDAGSFRIELAASELRANKEILHPKDYGRYKKGGASEWKQDERLIILLSNQI